MTYFEGRAATRARMQGTLLLHHGMLDLGLADFALSRRPMIYDASARIYDLVHNPSHRWDVALPRPLPSR